MNRLRRGRQLHTRDYIIAAVLALVLMWLLSLVWGIYKKEEIARRAVADTKKELALLQEREETLTENLEELATPRGEEATLRQTYGVALPGEQVIIVVPPKEATSTPELPTWRKVMRFFKL